MPPAEIEPALRAVYREVTGKGPGGHILTGPVYGEGAEPGDTLEVRIGSIRLAIPYAYNAFRPVLRCTSPFTRAVRCFRPATATPRRATAKSTLPRSKLP